MFASQWNQRPVRTDGGCRRTTHDGAQWWWPAKIIWVVLMKEHKSGIWEMGSSGSLVSAAASSGSLVNAAAWTTQTGVGSSGSAAVVCMEGRSQGPESPDLARAARTAPATPARPAATRAIAW
jgi:hypothetical protein